MTGRETMQCSYTLRQTFGELVLLGFAVADYAPATYLRRHLRRP